MTDITVDLPLPARALAVGAHPDDVEFGCGGTLAKWAASGCEILHLVCTDGSKGSWDPDQDVAELVAMRRDEQRAAARALGGSGEVVFCGWTDGELQAGLRQRWEVASWIRRLRPEVILGHDPWKRYRLHPDHRAAGFLLTDGIVAARDPHFFPELAAPPHRPTTLLLWEADEPDHVEDVSAHLDTKLAALLCHRSQYRSTMRIADEPSAEELEQFRQRVHDRAREHGRLAGLDYGESFKAIRDL
ncbi:MAG TPA: PIG-L family deacetylase [Acidimicrobiales bacterium]|nr:PIG-L family deacetylase [Acidimicrobiales bacterium]